MSLPQETPLLDPGVAERVIARTLQNGGDFAEVYAERRHGLSVQFDDGRLEGASDGAEEGVGVRLVVGDATYFGHVDSLAEPELIELAQSLSQASKSGASKEVTLVSAARVAPQRVTLPPEEVELVAKIEMLRACDETARAAGGEITQVSAGFGENRRTVTIYNSEGLATGDDRIRVRLAVQAIAARDGRIENGTETLGGHVGYELIADDPTKIAASAARKALTALDAVPAPAGKMPVVVGNGFGGVLLHEAVGHGLEADAVQKGASVYAGKIGEQLAPKFVNAYDDGRKPGEWGTDGIDDEGMPTQQIPILEDGVLGSFLHDRRSAQKDGVVSTGNGRRESFRHLPVPRMTNTYFAPGDEQVADLIEAAGIGLYAVSFGGGQVEPATGDFVFGVSEGYLIEGGRVTKPVTGATLTGNGLAALWQIEAIAGDLKLATGYCGKAGQRVPAGVGQPHVLLRELTVGGTA
ncbi:MAG: TldD/PmbA family protein [Solirubrobacterales bacterium]|nr:TldD/PmbA family protein [Solirubrobacterales bacterium]